MIAFYAKCKSIWHVLRGKEILRTVSFAFLFLTACTQEALIVNIKSTDISGSASMFKANGTLSNDPGSLQLSCSTAVASLHLVQDDGSVASEALASSPIEPDGSFKISPPGTISKLKSAEVKYVILAKGCGSEFCRPVTDSKDQWVSGASTLICLATEVTGNRSLAEIGREELKTALTSLNSVTGATNLLDLLESLIADTTLATTYQTLTGVSATKLKELPPSTITYTAPLSLHESTSNTYQVSVNHWNSNYEVAYQWTLDGVVVGTAATYIFSPGMNSQGAHDLVLTIGSKDAGGNLDGSKPTKLERFPLVVSNDYPAVAPSIAVTAPAVSGLPISTRSLTLGINTGTSKGNCATFSKMALTESTTAVPAATDFNITCTTAGTQALNHTLTSLGDGRKVLRLWVMDGLGNISATPSMASVDLDTAAPSAAITSTLPSITNGTSQSISFSANDNGGSIDHFECKLNSGSYTNCSSPKIFSGLTQGTHTVSVRAVDTATNTSADVTGSWMVDLTAPTVSFSAAPASVTNSLSSSFSFAGSDTGGGSISRYECKLDSGSYSTCTSPKLDVLTSGAHTLLVKAFDTAGNVSDVLSYSWTIDTTAPSATISSKPAALTNSQNASFTFAGSDSGGGTVVSYQCAIDGGSYAACTNPRSYTGLTAGPHTFAVRALDSAGNTGLATSYNWTIDLSTPMASINSGPDSITNQTSATFTFSANPPPAGSITGYQCSLDGAAYTSCTSPQTYNALSQGSHTFGVKSVDNNSALSAAVTESWTIDTTNPVATISSAPPTITNSTTGAISFGATDSGGAAVANYECKLNAASYAACTSPVNLSGLTEGAYTYSVRAIDTAGNTSAPVTASWTIDLTAPSTTISSAPNAITNADSAAFSFSATDSGGSSVASYKCRLDSAAFSTCTSPISYVGLSAGVHTFAVQSLDGTGNEEVAKSFSWTIDRINPTVTITNSPPAQSNSATATFHFSGSDTGGGSLASYECSVDGGVYSACTSPRNLTGLSQGSHVFRVRSLDTAGNTSAADSFTWNVDTVAPSLAITTPGADGGVIATSSLNNVIVSGACETGLNVVFSGASTSNTVCSSGTWTTSLNFTSLTDGTLSLTATQTDAAGNATSVTRTFIKDTQAPTISLTAVPSAPQKGGGTFTLGFNATEANITSAQNFTISYSVNNGSTWTSAGTMSSSAGPLSSQAFSYALTFPAATDTTQFKIRVSAVDAAGNTGTSSSSAAFTVDSTPPTLSSFEINAGASVALSPTLTVKVNATDSLSGVSAIRFADAQSGNCQASYANNNWRAFVQGGGIQTYSYLTGFVNGMKQICVWAKDLSGNVSEISANSNAGDDGVDMAKIRLDQGNPPVFTSLSVTNGNVSSGNFGTTTFAAGDTVTISFTVTDDAALANYPIEIYVTTDNSTFTQVANSSAVGSPGTAQTSWTKTYSSYLAPSASFFRIRLVAKDANGNTAQIISPALNSGKWSLFAGNEDIGDGSSALSAALRFSSMDGSRDKVVANTRNEIFVATRDGLRKIDPVTGNISTYLKLGSLAGIPGTLSETSSARVANTYNLAIDGDILYFAANGYLFRINTVTNEIAPYAGGGTSVTSTDPSQIYVWSQGSITIDPITKDLYFVNTCSSSDTSSSSATISVKIQKITQNPSTKAALAVSDVAGNCIKNGSFVDGGDALATTMDPTTAVQRHAHGSLLYVPELSTLYFSPYGGNLVKIKNGKVYIAPTSALGTSARGGVYIPGKNKIYYAKTGSGIFSFTPTSSDAFDETVTLEINPEGACAISSCRDNGVGLSSAALTAGSVFRVGDQLGVADTVINGDSQGRLLILDDATNTLQTLAGTDRFSGDGLDRSLARFTGLTKMVYKTVATAGFPVGLYAMDSGALRLLQMDPAQSTIHIRAGNGVGTSITSNQAFSVDTPLGPSSSSSTQVRNIAINPLNGFTFYSTRYIWNVKTDGLLEPYLYNSSVSIFTRADGYNSNVSRLGSGEHKAGFIYDSAGNLYFGGYQNPATQSESSGQAKIMVRRANGTFYSVIGNSTVATSTDCATAGCAQAKTINPMSSSDDEGSVNLGAYDNRYNANEGRLLFTEGTKIRFVSRAWDPTNSKYGTLTDYTGAAIDFGRSVGAFVYTYVDSSSEQIDKLYYVSNNKLYCKKLSSGADATCTGASVGPSTGLPGLSPVTLTLGPNGEIYALNSAMNAIYKYVP